MRLYAGSLFLQIYRCDSPLYTGRRKTKTARAAKKEQVEEPVETERLPELTDEQRGALEIVRPAIDANEHRVFLVQGVTNSGKTEVYMRVIADCLAHGKTAVMLVPEISLTPQTIRRFTTRSGAEAIAVLHSRLSALERYEQWLRVRRGDIRIVIGARSALFAPFENIGVFILDEEHEATYKSDMTPKYDAREVAIQRAAFHQAVVLLGSATPSLESAYRAEKGEYTLIRLHKRFNEGLLPAVTTVDMREELLQGNKSIFSRLLYEKIQETLAEKKQVILFLNRRGYTTFLSCRSCGFVMRCRECGISMTFHKAQGTAVCHYCGRKEAVPTVCPVCGSKYIRQFGTGTEKVEEAALTAFPDTVIDRLDLDTAKRKGNAEKILSRFAKGKTAILIGTQLVAKGLDFSNVGLVGILSADLSLNLPDYRSPERTFQLVTQAAGRAGAATNGET